MHPGHLNPGTSNTLAPGRTQGDRLGATTIQALMSRLPLRSRLAIGAGRTVAGASKLAHLGTGSVIGGRVSIALDGDLLARLTAGREVALVSGTNGKTTTTHLLAAALETRGPVVSNSLGANMPPGLVAALGQAVPEALAALEVDERWLPHVLEAVGPATVLLLNLSRDQLDRSHEVRKIADRWREALRRLPTEQVIASADDPLVVWAASGAPNIVWVGTGLQWTLDASGCPKCAGRIEFSARGEPPAWRCLACDLARPDPKWWLDGDELVHHPSDDRGQVAGEHRGRIVLDLALPGRANAANAAMVLAASYGMGADLDLALSAVRTVRSVAGRYRSAPVEGCEIRMFLAKNPAGWVEAIDMLAPAPRPVIASINARIADGRDPSWLWDVPYEYLRGRLVIATGERRHDLAVRLNYAEVQHDIAGSLRDAVRRISSTSSTTETTKIDLIANYTAFQDYLDEVGREDAR